jgi:NAD(P)-dependent dehydrogenase (short-subunit alcohol dehydrogenase family)
MPIRFDDRVVIVTGAGGGLGRAHALGFAALGAKVVVNDLGSAVDGSGASARAADIVADEITCGGGKAMADEGSVTDAGAIERLVERILSAFGRIDVVVANAGFLRDKSFGKMDRADWDAILDVHLTGTFNIVRAAWPHMRERGYGRIVVTSSSSGLFGNFGQANYAAAKLGLVGFMRTLAIEGEKHGIRANALAPIAWTRMTAKLFPPGADAVFEPEKVTPGVLFLASEHAPNGMVLSAGGGAFAVAEIVEGPAVQVSTGVASVDDVAAAWERISTTAGASSLPAASAQTMKFFESIVRARQA